MKLNHPSKALAALLVITAPFLLAAPGASLAKKPGNRPACTVGTAAYPTIQSAVNDVACASIGVPAGTFHENVSIPRRSVSIRGAGPDRTIVDGSWNSAPVFLVPLPSSGFVMCGPPPIAVSFEGMTVTGGTGPASGINLNGGGIAGFWVTMTIDNLIVTGNSAAWHGGGLSMANGSLTIKDSVVTNNRAQGSCGTNPCPVATGGGGGIRAAGCPNTVSVYDSVISNNVSDTLGGGISVYGALKGGNPPIDLPAATLTVKDSIITGNTAAGPNGGGGIFYDHTTLTVRNTEISGNSPNNVQQGPNP